jgi:hypothetical protein
MLSPDQRAMSVATEQTRCGTDTDGRIGLRPRSRGLPGRAAAATEELQELAGSHLRPHQIARIIA